MKANSSSVWQTGACGGSCAEIPLLWLDGVFYLEQIDSSPKKQGSSSSPFVL